MPSGPVGQPAEPFAVGFDFDHTLGLDNGLEATALYRLAAELGHSLSERDIGSTTFIAAVLSRFRAGTISLDEAIDEFVVGLGTPPAAAHAVRYRELCYSLVDELVTPIDGACELVATLSKHGVPMAILTNGWSPLQHLKIARALNFTGPVLVSDELGILKPDPAAFDKLVAVLAVPRDRIWFVGDNPNTDIAGAQGAGLLGVWFDWEHMAYPADAPQPDVRINSLHELLRLLPGSNAAPQNFAVDLDGHA